MHIRDPPPRGSPFNTQYTPTDYNIMAPSQQICQGKPAGPVVRRLTAGEKVSMQFATGGATHGGGGCQFSLSYDAGNSFIVIHTTDRACPTVPTVEITIPASAPSCDKCILAWSWIPVLSGGPEFYMNCIDVSITGTASSPLKGDPMFIFNLPGYPRRTGGLIDANNQLPSGNSVAVVPTTSTGATTTSSPSMTPVTTSAIAQVTPTTKMPCGTEVATTAVTTATTPSLTPINPSLALTTSTQSTATSLVPTDSLPGCSALVANKAYRGRVVGYEHAADPKLCCRLCSQYEGCNAFTWTPISGGTCLLKKRKGKCSRKQKGVFSGSYTP